MTARSLPKERSKSIEQRPACPHCSGSQNVSGEEAVSRQLSGVVSFEEIARVALDGIGEAVLAVDPNGRVIYLNKAAEKSTGWSRQEALGRTVEDTFFVVDGTTRERSINLAQLAIKDGRPVEVAQRNILINRNGTEMAIEESVALIHDRLGQVAGAVIIFLDARQSGTAMRRLRHLALHDFLTGLPNRALFMERLDHAIGLANRHRKKIALLYLDLDNFKQINDTFGHVIGDHLLRDVAAEVVSCVRDTDTVSRQGGDEFIVLLNEIEERQNAIQIAEKIRARLAASRLVDGQEVQVTLSIGISVYPVDGTSADILIRHADTAMYCAKKFGRNNYQLFRRSFKRKRTAFDSHG